MLFHILVQESSPVHDKQAMGIVLRPWDSLQRAFRNQLSHENGCSSLYTLSSIIGERHLFPVKLDAVTEYTEHSTGSHDIAIEALFLQRNVLGKSSLVNQVHSLFHRVLDVLVIRCQGKEIMMEHLDMALCLHVQGFFHVAPVHQDWDIAIEDINLLLRIIDHSLGCPDATQGDYNAPHKKEAAKYEDKLDFVF